MTSESTAEAAKRPGIPVVILTGFLGSGKTTLLNHILRNQAGIRVCVFVNEFGKISIDRDLILASSSIDEASVVTLDNGCICCTINEHLVEQVLQVVRKGGIDAIFLETSGVADVVPVLETFVQLPELCFSTHIDAVITLIDASLWIPQCIPSTDGIPAAAAATTTTTTTTTTAATTSTTTTTTSTTTITAATTTTTTTTVTTAAATTSTTFASTALAANAAGPSGEEDVFRGNNTENNNPSTLESCRRQVKEADIVIINKVDAISETQLQAVEADIRSISGAPLLRATFGQVPVEILFGVQRKPSSSSLTSDHAASTHLQDMGYTSLSFTFDRPFDAGKFESFIQTLSSGILRAKGILWFHDVERGVIFQLSGRRTNPMELDGRATVPSQSRLVFIGTNLSRSELQSKLERCLKISGQDD
eukprot:gb/GEZN01008079.1/.p1 GENE.gb/GEZN01008079.1/~~gb/GEZN01008079.1/.p1  ORF type:complete len:469 (-),score=190.52 gb/GEZN01008079.1/:62-1324(-)